MTFRKNATTLSVGAKPDLRGGLRIAHLKVVKATTSTLSKGARTVTLPKVAKGTWKVTVKYYGSTNHASSTRVSSVTVK